MKTLSEKDAARARRLVANIDKAEAYRVRLWDRGDRLVRVAEAEGRKLHGDPVGDLSDRGEAIVARHHRRLTRFILARTDWRPARNWCDAADGDSPSLALDGRVWLVAAECISAGNWQYVLQRVALADALTAPEPSPIATPVG